MAIGLPKYSTDDRGRIRIYVGFHVNGKGKRTQMPFYFGYDPSQVPARHARVDELWQQVVKHSKDLKPVWDSTSLWIAKQLEKGNVQIVIPKGFFIGKQGPLIAPEPLSAALVAYTLKQMAKAYPMVYFVAEDEAANKVGQQHWEALLAPISDDIEEMTGVKANVLPKETQTFFQAIDAYLAAIPAMAVQPTQTGQTITAHGFNRLDYAGHFKDHHRDCPLTAFDDVDGIQALVDYWRNRPFSPKTGGPMALTYCKHHLDEMNRFFKWVSKSKSFAWKKPEDYDEIDWRVRSLPSEKTDIKLCQVDTFTVDELAVIYRHATNLERLLILLGLNCTFGASEMGTLEEKHLFLKGPHPNRKYLKQFNHIVDDDERFIIYARHKTGVHGEFLLWPETLKAIQWQLARRANIETESPYLLVTEGGRSFLRKHSKNETQHFRNKWDDLFVRMENAGVSIDWKPKPLSQAADGSVRRLSFGKLRKTATDFMRQFVDGEAGSCFEMHDRVTTDDLLDIYSNRPWGKVFAGLRQMHTAFEPIFQQDLVFPDGAELERRRGRLRPPG